MTSEQEQPNLQSPAEQEARIAALTTAARSLRNECQGLLGAFHRELVEATSVTNVRVLEHKVAAMDELFAIPAPPKEPT